MDIDLHQLANQPGFGTADRILTQSGHPKEGAVPTEWEIEVEYSVGYRDTITVEASCESDAKRKAEEMVRECPGGGVAECVEIYGTNTVRRGDDQ